jgi:hypothetical protein
MYGTARRDTTVVKLCRIVLYNKNRIEPILCVSCRTASTFAIRHQIRVSCKQALNKNGLCVSAVMKSTEGGNHYGSTTRAEGDERAAPRQSFSISEPGYSEVSAMRNGAGQI